MRGEHLLHRAGREAVACDVDDVVGARHDEDVAVLVDVAGVGRLVVARDTSTGTPRGSARPRSTASARRPAASAASPRARRSRRAATSPPLPVEHAQVPARNGSRRRARLDRQAARSRGSSRRSASRSRSATSGRSPARRASPRPSAASPDRSARPRGRARAVVRGRSPEMSSPSGSCCRIARNAVGAVKSVATPCSLDHAPERARVGRADGLSLVEHRRASRGGAARRRCRSGRRPSRRPTPPSTPRRARRRRRSSSTTRARPRGRRCRGRCPSAGRSSPTCRGCRADRSPRRATQPTGSAFAIASFHSTSRPATSSASSSGRWRMMQRSGFTAESSIAASSSGLYATMRDGSMPHDADTTTFGLRVLDPARQLVRGEAAEDDGVHGADPRAGEHRDRGLRHHRHVDDHPVAALDALRGERAGEARDRVAQLAVREGRGRLA